MVASMKSLATLLIGLAVVASASSSQARESSSRVSEDFGGPPYVGIEQISTARWNAIHVCSERAARWPEYVWGNMESYQYRTCMYEHQQPE
jgi:hypothetical protein